MPAEPLRVLLVDDEPLARQGLREFCAAVDGVAVVGEACDGFDAAQQIEQLRPQLVLLDVQMPGMDGFEVLAQFEPGERPAVVFVTAFDRYALRAFDAHAVDYLLKPFDEPRFRTALARARERLQHGGDGAAMAHVLADAEQRRADRFVVKHAGRLRVVPATAIEWIEARGNYVHLHAPDGPFLLRRTLASLHKALAPARFARVHRSAIVALATVVDWARQPSGDYEVRLQSGARVAMSRSHRAEFERLYGARE